MVLYRGACRCVSVFLFTVYLYGRTSGVFRCVSVCFGVCPLAAAWPLCPGGGNERGEGRH